MFETTREFSALNSAIASFNTTAQELEYSYKVLHEQVEHLNRELEDKNKQLKKNLVEKERTQNFLYTILESLPTGVVVIDLSGKLLMSNKAVEKITGICPSELDKQRFSDWLKTLGIGFSHLPQSHTIEFTRHSGDVRDLTIVQSAVTDSTGQSIGFLYIIQDQTRLKKLEVQSERDQRLKAMGEMAIQIAHEVRNPLGSIELFASILRNDLAEQSDLKKMANHIITEVKSLDNSISNLLLFTRPQDPIFSPLDIAEFIEEFVEFIRPVVKKNSVELTVAACPAPLMIAADKDLLKQIFLNLTINSMQAMGDGGRVHIAAQLNTDEDGSDDSWIEILFTDTGHGIAQASLNKIFHPFYTTKEKGTGLGLAIVHNIIESHKGTIQVRSEAQRGTTFLLSFPRARGGI